MVTLWAISHGRRKALHEDVFQSMLLTQDVNGSTAGHKQRYRFGRIARLAVLWRPLIISGGSVRLSGAASAARTILLRHLLRECVMPLGSVRL
jgi:hypothetical protein